MNPCLETTGISQPECSFSLDSAKDMSRGERALVNYQGRIATLKDDCETLKEVLSRGGRKRVRASGTAKRQLTEVTDSFLIPSSEGFHNKGDKLNVLGAARGLVGANCGRLSHRYGCAWVNCGLIKEGHLDRGDYRNVEGCFATISPNWDINVHWSGECTGNEMGHFLCCGKTG
jgi:hypothetical protein